MLQVSKLKLKHTFSKVLIATLTMSVVSGCQSLIQSPEKAEAKPHNFIYLIGDGMGIAQTTAYRYYKANQADKVRGDKQIIDTTAFDDTLVGMAATYPADHTLVTDSAASATALATGFKSFNKAIGVTPDHQAQLTLLERAKQLGMTTGIVATAQINHATPASFLAHIDSRHKYNDIADQYLSLADTDDASSPIGADILLGGGTKYFLREDRKLVAELQQNGYQYVDNLSDLAEVNDLPVIGLFAKKGLPFAIDSEQPNRLTTMTASALKLAAKANKGFFLMIEGSQIDWCSHGNDIACTMAEMADFEQTLALVLEYAKQDGNTTVVVTADHSTGGLTLGRDKEYVWHAELVHNIHISADKYATLVTQGQDPVALWQQYVDLALSEAEQATLNKAAMTKDKETIHHAFALLTSMKTGTGWTTTGHTAEDVQVFAYGPHKDDFAGYQDNTDIAKALFKLLDRYY